MTWELLQEQQSTTIEELCELLFENVGIDEAYTVWLLVSQGEYFSFDDDFNIVIHSLGERDAIVKERQEKQKEQELNDFIERVKQKVMLRG